MKLCMIKIIINDVPYYFDSCMLDLNKLSYYTCNYKGSINISRM